mgnify:CR=1 FL=1
MRINELLALLNRLPYFTKQNLSLSLGKEGENLNYWIKKLIRDGFIIQIKKGFYIPSFYKAKGESYFASIANIARYPSYVSLEYALAKYGLIPESVFAITSVTTKSSRVYRSRVATFIYRSIKEDLFFGYSKEGPKIAYPYKALFDFLYLKKFTSEAQMKDYLKEAGRINWDGLSSDGKDSFAKIIKDSNSKKMQKILSICKKEGLLNAN